MPPPASGCPLSGAGVQRIVDAVGAQPNGLNLEELQNDLLWCFVFWCTLQQHDSNEIARKRVQRLKSIARAADSLWALLGNGIIGGWAREEVAMTFPVKEGAPVRKTAEFRTDHGQPDPAPSFDGFVAGFERLIEAARHKAVYFPDVALYRLHRSRLDFMVANQLPKVFEHHFRRHASILRPDSKA